MSDDELDLLPIFFTEVVRTAQVTPRMRRVTVGGGDLVDFVPAGPDQSVYLLLPPAGTSGLTVDAGLTWTAYRDMPDGLKPLGGYYTVRRHHPERAEIDIDMVLHGDDGPCSAWAARAMPGDPVALWGPRSAYAPPQDTDWQLLVADETGLPAVGAILESLRPDDRAHVFAEIEDEDEEQRLTTHGDVEITWLPRFGVPPGTPPLIIDAVREWELPGGVGYVWGGGETRAMSAMRRYIRRERGLPEDHVDLITYWRHESHVDDPIDAG